MDFSGDGLINFAVAGTVKGEARDAEGNLLPDRVLNSGRIQANGGQVTLSARDAGDVIRNVVNHEGVIEAKTVARREGRVFLMGGGKGTVNVAGTIDASGTNAGEKGGTVHVLGEKVGLFGNGRIDVSGDSGGGTALIGGDYQGGGGVPAATATFLGDGALIRADALTAGDGGKVIVWADHTTRAYGAISARGGNISGNGGLVETSGKIFLDVSRTPDVTSAHGRGGLWLLDPNDLEIVAGSGSANIFNGAPFFTTTNDTAQIGVDLITSALTGGASVTIATGTSGSNAQSGDITVSAPIDYNGKGTNSLGLSAHRHIVINDNIYDSDASGDRLNISLFADSAAGGTGTITVAAGKTVATGGGALSLSAADVDLQGTLNSGAARTSIFVSDGGTVGLGSGACAHIAGGCGMTLSGAELQNISTSGGLNIGSSANGAVHVDGITSADSANIGAASLFTGSNISFRNAASSFLKLTAFAFNGISVATDLSATGAGSAGSMILNADGDNNQSGAFTQSAGTTMSAGGDIVLTGASIATDGTVTPGSGFVVARSLTGGTTTVVTTSSGETIAVPTGQALNQAINSTFVTAFIQPGRIPGC
ncbi:MAG: hypothetical protein HZA02_02520 [Nitrospinae bacterium]|nr:hypothetical protein [Nitrospinota bacterium]